MRRRHVSTVESPSGNGRLALLGSGPGDAWTKTIIEELAPTPARAAFLAVGPTEETRRLAPAGDEILAELADPSAHAVIPVFDRGAHASALDAVSNADLVVVATEDPVRAVRALWSNPTWFATLGRLRDGALVAAIGQAAASMGSLVSAALGSWRRGLSLFPGAIVPAWDALWTDDPDAHLALTHSVPRTKTLVCIEERTAFVGSGGRWEVLGRDSVRIRTGHAWRSFQAGDVVRFPLQGNNVPREGSGGLRSRFLRPA
jgi:hypothetical protein